MSLLASILSICPLACSRHRQEFLQPDPFVAGVFFVFAWSLHRIPHRKNPAGVNDLAIPNRQPKLPGSNHNVGGL